MSKSPIIQNHAGSAADSDKRGAHYELPLRVYIEDTDAGGIVYYINYLKFMERARTELMRSLGFAKTAIIGDNLMFVVHSAQIQYRSPAKLDEMLTVTATVINARRASMLFEQKIFRTTQLLCSATVKIACVNQSDLKPAAMPAAVHTVMHELTTIDGEH